MANLGTWRKQIHIALLFLIDTLAEKDTECEIKERGAKKLQRVYG